MKTKLATTAIAVMFSIGLAGTAAAQNHASCDNYAKNYAKQVSSGAEVVGGAAIGAIGGAIVGGIINGGKGAGTGALIGAGTGGVAGAATHAQRYQDAYNYAYYNCMNQASARPAAGGGGGLQPWTQAWYQHCASKYKSFNPQTGYYTAYSGQKRFCQ